MKNWNLYLQIAMVVSLLVSMMPVEMAFASPIRTINEQDNIDSAISSGFEYLSNQINDDGGIRWFDESSSVAATIRVVQALAAEGYSQHFLVSDSGNRPIDFLEQQGKDWVFQAESDNPGFNVARAGQLLTAIAAANENPHNFGEAASDLIYEINAQYDPNIGVYGAATADSVLDQVWAMIGLSANNASIPLDAAIWLETAQREDGTWDDGFGSYLDTTPLAILALLGSGHTEPQSPSIRSAINFIQQNQQENGGWQSEGDSYTNPNITGVILQVISILGQKPTDETWQKPNGNPLTALLATRQENGVFGSEFGNAYSTADAITGLSGKEITSLGFLKASSKAFDFLIAKQNPDGGWGSPGQTLDVLLALQAAGWQPNSFETEGATPLAYLAANIEAYIDSGPDAIGKSILGISATGVDPTSFSNIDLSQRLMDTFSETDQVFGNPKNTWHQAFAILGLNNAGLNIPRGVIDTLIGLQQEDGGWEYTTGLGTSPDNTALAIQALLAAGIPKEEESIVKAINFLHSKQTPDGGWGDSSTTAFTLMALNALDEPLEIWKTPTKRDPLHALFSFQKPNGAFVYNWEMPDDNLMSTTAALLAIYDGYYDLPARDVTPNNKAAIVIVPGIEKVYVDCVEFENSSISGLELLQLSNFDYDNSEGYISSIMGFANDDGETNYWSYWTWNGREWIFNNVGANDTIVNSGTIQAWHFTSWQQFPSLPPRFVPDIDQICKDHILKNAVEQPFLDYNDLIDSPIEPVEQPDQSQESPGSTRTVEVEEMPVQETKVVGEKIPENHTNSNLENPQSNIALILIASVGGIALILILIIIIQKRQ